MQHLQANTKRSLVVWKQCQGTKKGRKLLVLCGLFSSRTRVQNHYRVHSLITSHRLPQQEEFWARKWYRRRNAAKKCGRRPLWINQNWYLKIGTNIANEYWFWPYHCIKVENASKLIFEQMEGKCYCCRKGGQCRYKSSPKEEWAINNSKTEEVVSFVQLQDG